MSLWQSPLLMGGVTTSILFFFSYGKFVSAVFEGLANERASFPKNYTLIMLDLRALACFFSFSLSIL